jgi:DNA-binding NarL/FixJ family response regulator
MRGTATIRKVQLGRIRVLIVDHNALLREGLSVLIRLHSDMELAGAAESGDESVRLFRDRKPDVILMDLDLPSGAGISAIQAIRAIDPSACLIGLCTYEWDASNTEALRAGAWNCLAKDRLNSEVIAMARKCHSEGCNRANERCGSRPNR